MDWSNFKTQGQAPTRAFEALAGMLFERWNRSQHQHELDRVILINGVGGDGGVEALAYYSDGSRCGLQAKWFRERLEANELGQIRKSINNALAVYPSLREYIVAVPRDLAHPKTKPKAGKPEKNTERDRWDALVAEFNKSSPWLTLTIWDEGRLASLLAEFGSDGLISYWFSKTVIRHDDLKLSFEQARAGWLSMRYEPDLHTAGQIEADLSGRVQGLQYTASVTQEFLSLEDALRRAALEIARLRRFAFFASVPNGQSLVREALDAVTVAAKEEHSLAEIVREGTTVLRSKPASTPLTAALQNLTEVIPPQSSHGVDVTREIRSAITNLISAWDTRNITPESLSGLARPTLYVGDPGSGKTHAFAAAVEHQLACGAPALLVRTRDYDARQKLQSLLRAVFGEPAWSQNDILDACEASAIFFDIQKAQQAPHRQAVHPTRFLLAFDGLDESPNAHEWKSLLGELLPITRRWPRICFVFSMRGSLRRQLGKLDEYANLFVDRSDADLDTIFSRYTELNRITCPPLLRWVLQTPLAVRLFTELYRNQVVQYEASAFTLESLIDRKLDRVELAVRDVAFPTWDHSLQPVRRTLQGLVSEYIKLGRPLTDTEATAAALSEQTGFGSIDTKLTSWILERLRDYGLLLVRSSRTSLLEPHSRTWEPAFEALTDFLLAHKVKSQIDRGEVTEKMPAYLVRRPDAVTVTFALLGSVGFDRLSAGMWSKDIDEEYRERLQCVALLHAGPYAPGLDWARQQFVRSMPSCRALLAELVIPGVRLPGHPYGGAFVHEILVALSVKVRDQFWSTPDGLPRNHGALWEGWGPSLDEMLVLAMDDAWDGLPLVAAWATTTCNNPLRRALRKRLACWASNKPAQLTLLLDKMKESNDPQMLEDILWSIYGAAYLSPSDGGWESVCDWLVSSIGLLHRMSPWNIEIYHARRAVIEFFCQKGVYTHTPTEVPNEPSILPLDSEAVHSSNKQWRVGALDRDLVWYVIPQAYEPFFPNEDHLRSRQERSNPSSIEALPNELLRDLACGRIRPMASSENRRNAEQELERRSAVAQEAERQDALNKALLAKTVRWYSSLTPEQKDEVRAQLTSQGHLFDLFDILVDSYVGDSALGVNTTQIDVSPKGEAEHVAQAADAEPENEDGFLNENNPSAIGGPATDDILNGCDALDLADGLAEKNEDKDASDDENKDDEVHVASSDIMENAGAGFGILQTKLLNAHAIAMGLSSLNAEQFALGYCQYRVAALGWDKSIHIKEPNGGEPGEVLGLDIAIMRRYGEASHGERSTISSMAEKYCWIARHELVGYLSHRLPAVCDDVLLSPPVDSSHFVETVSPATDHMQPYAELAWPGDPFRTLVPVRPDIEEAEQLKMANEWVATTPVPLVGELLSITSERLPKNLRPFEWIVLQVFNTREELETMGTSAIWISAFAVPESQASLVQEDARMHRIDGLEDFHSSVQKIEFYSDPSEVVWASWVNEVYDVRRHQTIDVQGSPCDVVLRALSCSFHWESPRGEEKLLMPSRWLLTRLNVSHVKNGQFCRTDNTVVAVLDKSRVLLARADLVATVLAKEEMRLCWGVRIFREPNTRLFNTETRFTRWNWYGFASRGAFSIDVQVTSAGVEDH